MNRVNKILSGKKLRNVNITDTDPWFSNVWLGYGSGDKSIGSP